MKLLKVYISAFCMCSLSLLLNSCDNFLKEEPLDMKSSDQFWKTKADAESGVNALYFGGVPYLHNTDVGGGWTPKATMWGGIVSGLYVDKRKDRTFTTASEGCNFNIESFDDIAMKYWHEFYKGISRANFVIANIPTMTSVLDEATINNYVAQGKFFRAYGYFWLVKEFGGVPYISEPYTSTEGMYKERLSAEEIYKNIETDLLDIVNGDALPNKTFYDTGCYVTKAMAQTLLAQVYLQWAGAPLNGGADYYDKAAQMALKVINEGPHSLIDPNGTTDGLNSAYNVIKTTKSSAEIIYAKEYNYSDYSVGNSYGHEKQFFFKEYTDASGKTHTLNNVGNWAWFDESALINGHDGDYNMPVFRYAEVLLIAAEGLARTGHEGDAVGGAKYYLNQVRKRAGLADETATGDALVQSILTERLHELPLEFKIWDDIRRTRLYPEASAEAGKLKWTALSSAQIQNKPDGSTRAGAIPEYALLWPIPLDEIQANPSLEGHQNPGWN